MTPGVFVTLVGLALALALTVAFKFLPRESWQFLASVPTTKTQEGTWTGMNFTYYGLLAATAETLAVAMVTFLLAATGVPASRTIAWISIVLVLCMPAARWVARIVDRRRYNFTVAGAAAVGMIAVPLSAAIIDWLGFSISLSTAYGAIAVAYAFGEGIGRLACISFGCCYGKALTNASPFQRFHFVFHGSTKKISYESGMEGVPVVPIQAITCCVNVAAGLASMWMFLEGHIVSAFVTSFFTCHAWRIYSETLRADDRGEGRISKYQMMALAGIVYTAVVACFLTGPATQPQVLKGLLALWDPFVILFHQSLWFVLFIYQGRSMVTGSEISLHLRQEDITKPKRKAAGASWPTAAFLQERASWKPHKPYSDFSM